MEQDEIEDKKEISRLRKGTIILLIALGLFIITYFLTQYIVKLSGGC